MRFAGKVYSINRCLTLHRDRPLVTSSEEFLGHVWMTCDEALSLPLAGPLVTATLELIPVALETAAS